MHVRLVLVSETGGLFWFEAGAVFGWALSLLGTGARACVRVGP